LEIEGWRIRKRETFGRADGGVRRPTPSEAIPGEAFWNDRVNGGYGNGSLNDYTAEAFSWSIYNPDYLPFGADGVVALVVNQTILQQAYGLP
jgi:hypothetical protein